MTVYASTNLASWLPIQTLNVSGTPVEYTDTTANAFPKRFYKVSAQ